ncbi:glycosyltransferase family 4 protein, partial [Candidatus Woesearchaeota archaeon]|nr:glycosyltransferase family 4 protein [Candidatus Woesearchaeota archaeon]
KCTKLFFPAQQAQLKYEEQGIVRPSVIIPLGVDPNRFKPSHSKPMAKRKIGIDATRLVIGFCGRIGREKDLWTLKKAFENVQKKGKVVLLIVGKGIPDIRLEGEGVIMAGQQEDVVPYLQAMDIYVLPSLTETTSLSTLEAMACALPVICTPVGAIKTYIKHRENGFLFPRGNVEKLTQYLMVLLKKPKRREELGLAARKTVKEQFHWENTAERIKHSLKNLL